MPIDSRYSVPFLPQQSVSEAILAAIQAANEAHLRQRQLALQQQAQPSEIALRQAQIADIQTQAAQRQQALELQKRGFDRSNTPIEQLSREDQAAYGVKAAPTPAPISESLPLGNPGAPQLSPNGFANPADFLRALMAQKNGQDTAAPRQDTNTPIVPNFRKVTETGQFQFDHPDSTYKVNPKLSPLENQIEQTVADLHLRGDDAAQMRRAGTLAKGLWVDPKQQAELLANTVKSILDRRAEDGRSAKATSLPSDMPGVNVITYTDRNGNVLHQAMEMDKTTDFTDTDPTSPLLKRTYKVDSLGRPVDLQAVSKTFNEGMLPSVTTTTEPNIDPATGQPVPGSLIVKTSTTQKLAPGQKPSTPAATSAASASPAQKTPAPTVAPGSVAPMTRQEYDQKQKTFTHDYVNGLGKTEKSFSQFQNILDDIDAGKDMTGAQSVVGLFNAIGLSAEPLQGKGFRINNNTVEEHATARSLGETLYQKFLKLKVGDVITPDQLKDYASIAANARHDAYISAADEFRRQFGNNANLNFLPKGNNRVIDQNTAKIFYDVYGGDPAVARQQAINSGWKAK